MDSYSWHILICSSSCLINANFSQSELMFMQHRYLHNTLPYLQIAPIFPFIQLLVLQ